MPRFTQNVEKVAYFWLQLGWTIQSWREPAWAVLVLLVVYLMTKYTARTNVAMCQAENLCASNRVSG